MKLNVGKCKEFDCSTESILEELRNRIREGTTIVAYQYAIEILDSIPIPSLRLNKKKKNYF